MLSISYFDHTGCYSHPNDMDRGYPEFGYYLNQTGRPMIYACSWPVYQTYSGMTVIFTYRMKFLFPKKYFYIVSNSPCFLSISFFIRLYSQITLQSLVHVTSGETLTIFKTAGSRLQLWLTTMVITKIQLFPMLDLVNGMIQTWYVPMNNNYQYIGLIIFHLVEI